MVTVPAFSAKSRTDIVSSSWPMSKRDSGTVTVSSIGASATAETKWSGYLVRRHHGEDTQRRGAGGEADGDGLAGRQQHPWRPGGTMTDRRVAFHDRGDDHGSGRP